jgi:hypothetical protein
MQRTTKNNSTRLIPSVSATAVNAATAVVVGLPQATVDLSTAAASLHTATTNLADTVITLDDMVMALHGHTFCLACTTTGCGTTAAMPTSFHPAGVGRAGTATASDAMVVTLTIVPRTVATPVWSQPKAHPPSLSLRVLTTSPDTAIVALVVIIVVALGPSSLYLLC